MRRENNFDDSCNNTYCSVAERRRNAEARTGELAAELGRPLEPVVATSKAIAGSFWGRAWCRNIESYQDYESRLPRGRSYLRNGQVLDLVISPGRIEAYVSGEELYQIKITIAPVEPERWREIRRACAGKIDSLADLAAGRLSAGIIELLCNQETGLFPTCAEIRLDCNCPDWSNLCKHLAAVLYGVGVKLDAHPELFFVLRGVSERELFDGFSDALPPEAGEFDVAALGDAFGIELDDLQ